MSVFLKMLQKSMVKSAYVSYLHLIKIHFIPKDLYRFQNKLLNY